MAKCFVSGLILRVSRIPVRCGAWAEELIVANKSLVRLRQRLRRNYIAVFDMRMRDY